MGMCYSVTLYIKPKNESDAFRALLADMHLNERENRANYNFAAFRRNGNDADTLESLIRIVLADWPSCQFRKSGPDKDGFVTYENDFDARYGWEYIMILAFRALAPHLHDGSSFVIGTDDDTTEYTVTDGAIL